MKITVLFIFADKPGDLSREVEFPEPVPTLKKTAPLTPLRLTAKVCLVNFLIARKVYLFNFS